MVRVNLVVVILLACSGVPTLGVAQTPGCAPPSDTRQDMVDRFKVIVSATSSGSDYLRSSLNLPELPDTSVVAVTDSTTCAALSAAQADHYSEAPQHVIAVRIGSTRYAVFDIGKRNGEWHVVSIYSSTFTYLVSMQF